MTGGTQDPLSWTIRKADADDLESLVRMRCLFLEEIGNFDPSAEDAIRHYLTSTLRSGPFHSWIAMADSEVIATSGLLFVRKPPHARNLSGQEGYVMNMYTLPPVRRQGIGTALLREVLQYCAKQRVSTLRLHTLESAERIYRTAGFQRTVSEMVLVQPIRESNPTGLLDDEPGDDGKVKTDSN